jgi:hyaluronate lyase
MMDLEPAGGQLSARKSWFLFDDELVALGAGIHGGADDKPVETIVENRRITSEGTFTADPEGAWAHLSSTIPDAAVGYYFPGQAPWNSRRETRHDTWRAINHNGSTEDVAASYHTLWFDHGKNPQNAAYAYIVLPAKTVRETAVYAGSPAVEIVQNDATVQAVRHAGLGIRAVNFWAAAAHPVAGIGADGIACVLVREAGGMLNIAVSDPTQENSGVLHVEVAVLAGTVVSADQGVTVDRIAPTVRLSVNVQGSHGKTLRASLRAARP